MQYRNSQNKTTLRPAPKTVTLLDPVFRCGLLEIPVDKTYPTKGRDEWLQGRLDKDLSLCCLFQKGRCHAQERCFQVHVDKDFMTALRDQQSRIVSCCRNCNDTASLSASAMTFFSTNMPSLSTRIHVAYQNGSIREIDAGSIAFSAGLIQQFDEHGARVEQGVLSIPSRRICRLHLRGGCKYGKDCKNVHTCTKLGEKFLDAPMTPHTAPLPVVPAVRALPAFAARKLEVVPVAQPPVPQAKPLGTFSAMIPTAEERLNPLTGFGIFDRNAKSFSHSSKSLDAIDVCENSARLKSFLFDAAAALDDSAMVLRPDDSSSLGGNSDTASWIAASSPGQKRRGSNHAVHLDSMHPCSQAAPVDYLGACRITHWDQWNSASLFA